MFKIKDGTTKVYVVHNGTHPGIGDTAMVRGTDYELLEPVLLLDMHAAKKLANLGHFSLFYSKDAAAEFCADALASLAKEKADDKIAEAAAITAEATHLSREADDAKAFAETTKAKSPKTDAPPKPPKPRGRPKGSKGKSATAQ